MERRGPHNHPPETAVALILGDPWRAPSGHAPLVRIHSECLTGDVLGSLRCDCGEQLKLALGAIAEQGCGLLIYEQQEGRGIGLMAKLRAYSLQDQGLDTIAANRALGYAADCRDFGLPGAILNHLGIRQYSAPVQTILKNAMRWPGQALLSWSRFRAKHPRARGP